MKIHEAFTYTENRDMQTQHRLWIGPLLWPEGSIGINTCTVRRSGVEASEIALPMSALPHLIQYLQQIVDTEGIDL